MHRQPHRIADSIASAVPELTLTVVDIALLLVLGLGAGVVGGMLGIGGSIITIPAMAIIFFARPWSSQHLFQATAMISNVFVAIPAARKHMRSGLLAPGLHRKMLPATMIAIVVGVLVSDQLSSRVLKLLFALFLLWVVIESIVKLMTHRHDYELKDANLTPARAGVVGGVMGLVAGLLGVGGGAVAVPMAHKVCRLPLTNCIAASAAVMCITAPVGAVLKVARIGAHGSTWHEPVVLALMLAPTAILGSHFGASLTRRVPVRVLRALFALAVLAAAIRLFWQVTA
ncbi:MAG: sulfite exporter TauE/SafE family protein, partial [Phycisphaerales bacterium]|nr:sulfite exporter TauE/SafE family protein [Phycisphaerales bacterium]